MSMKYLDYAAATPVDIYETNLRFFSSRRQKGVTFCRAAFFMRRCEVQA